MSLKKRLERLEAAHPLRVVLVFPDGVRDGWGRPASLEQAGVVIRLPQRVMTSTELDTARQAYRVAFEGVRP